MESRLGQEEQTPRSVRLARRLIDAGLVDDAVEAFEEVLAETRDCRVVCLELILLLQAARRWDEADAYSRKAVEMWPSRYDTWSIRARVCHGGGSTAEAAAASARSFAYLPSNERLREMCRAVSPGDRPTRIRRPKKHLKRFLRAGFTAPLYLDNIWPVLAGARPYTCCFGDQIAPPVFPCIGGLPPEELLPTVIETLARLSQVRIGLLAHLYPGESLPSVKFFFFPTDEGYARLNELQRRFDRCGEAGAVEMYLKAVEAEGRLLGYPECCLSAFIERRGQGLALAGWAEESVARALIHEEVDSPDGICDLETALSFFTFEFYPCRPGCEEARTRGVRLLSTMGKLSKLYMAHVVLGCVERAKSLAGPYEQFWMRAQEAVSRG